MRRTLSPRRASAYDRYTVRGVDQRTISVLAGLLRVAQGDIINAAIQHFVRHLYAAGKLPEALAKCLTTLDSHKSTATSPPSASGGGR